MPNDTQTKGGKSPFTKFITRTFLKGLAVVLPVVAGVYVILLFARDTENLVRDALEQLLPADVFQHYVPGLGVVLVVVLVFLLGLLMYPWLTRKLFDLADALFRRIPLFGNVYGPVRDLMDLLGGDMTKQLGQVVMIEVPNTNMETLGFITREDATGLPPGMIKDDHVVVYVQWSSQIGGYCFVVPKTAVRPLDMTVEEGMRWALTAGISAPRKDKAEASSHGGATVSAQTQSASNANAEGAGERSKDDEATG